VECEQAFPDARPQPELDRLAVKRRADDIGRIDSRQEIS
jgi:hypothetical protein